MKGAIKKLVSTFELSGRKKQAQSSSHTQAQGARKVSRTISGTVSHGLFILHPPPELADSIDSRTVDIVAVHGLNGKARDTWKDEASGMLWLEDFLPEALPQARIMTFGYDSSLLLSHSKGRIEDFARDLLNRLWMLRQSPEAKNRPLVFVAHSLGGIVVKKALILAREDSRHYGNILTSTIGVLFLATPHQGSNIVNWTSFLRNAIQITSRKNLVRTDLIKELSKHSHTLIEISKSFLPRSADLTIMSFVETQSEPPLTILVVPLESARLDLPNEIVFPVNAHHRNICRYPSAKDQTYALVEASIKSIVSDESTASPTRTATTIVTHINKENKAIDTKFSIERDPSYAPSPASGVAGPASPVLKAPTLEHSHQKEEDEGDTKVTFANAVDKPGMSTLRITGLKPKISAKERGWAESTIELHVRSNTPIKKLPYFLEKRVPNIHIPKAFKFRGRSTPIADMWFDCFTVPVKVTKGRPCYKESLGYRIHAHQSIASFLSRIFPDPIDAKLRRYPKWMQASTGFSHSVAVGRDDSSSLQISFNRTTKVRGGKKSYLPPRGLGTFPLFNTQLYRDRLPAAVAAQGGFFLPMYESEAMYIAFDCQASHEFAVRPFIGGVNGISGMRFQSTESAKSAGLGKQDYIVVPAQQRLDGISVRPGVVNQFVATKMNPEPRKKEVTGNHPGGGQAPENGEVPEPRKGGTIEWQMTGKDEVGGIQLQIIPQFRLSRMFAGSMRDACPREHKGVLRSYQPVPDDAVVYDVLKTPEELGLREGDFIHVKDLEPRPKSKRKRSDNREAYRNKKVVDLAAESPFPSDTLELEVLHEKSRVILTVRGINTDKEPVRFRIDADDDFDDILAAAQDAFEMPDGEFSIPGLVVNNPDILFPIHNWSDYFFVAEPAVSYEDFWKLRQFHEPIIKEFDVVLTPSTAKRRNVCHLNFLNGASELFKNINKPLMLEISWDSTIADVRLLVQETTGLSTQSFRFASPSNVDVDDNCMVYADREMNENSPDARPLGSDGLPIAAFALDDGVALFIKTPFGRTFGLQRHAGDTIETIKLRIQDRENIPPHCQWLIFNGKRLEDKRTLEDYGIEHHTSPTLHLVLRLVGGGVGGRNQSLKIIKVKTIKVELARTIVFDGCVETVGRLKMRLFEQLGIFPHRQDLSLPDDYSLEGQDLTLKLQIFPQERKPLGLCAGGSILQEIRADTSDPRIWDVGGSKILYVHIVNSRDFKDITGLPPPDTRLLWPKQRQDGPIHDFKGKSISFDGVFDSLISLEEDNCTESESQRERPRPEGCHDPKSPYDMQKVPSFPLVLLETDHTLPWFKAMDTLASSASSS